MSERGNVIDSLSVKEKLGYLKKLLPQFKHIQTKYEQYVQQALGLIDIYSTRFRAAKSSAAKRFYFKQNVQLAKKVHLELTDLLENGKVSSEFSEKYIAEGWIHNRAKHKDHYKKGSLLTVFSIDGFQYELLYLPKFSKERTQELVDSLNEQVDVYVEKSKALFTALGDRIVPFIRAACKQKTDYSLWHLKTSYDLFDVSDEQSEIRMHTEDLHKNNIQHFLVINEFEEALVNPKRSRVLVVDDDDPSTSLGSTLREESENAADTSLNAIKRDFGVNPKLLEKHRRNLQKEETMENPIDAYEEDSPQVVFGDTAKAGPTSSSSHMFSASVLPEVRGLSSSDQHESSLLDVPACISVDEVAATTHIECTYLERGVEVTKTVSLTHGKGAVPKRIPEIVSALNDYLWTSESADSSLLLVPPLKYQSQEKKFIIFVPIRSTELMFRSEQIRKASVTFVPGDDSLIKLLMKLRNSAPQGCAPFPYAFLESLHAALSGSKFGVLKIDATQCDLTGHSILLSELFKLLLEDYVQSIEIKVRDIDSAVLAVLILHCSVVDTAGCKLQREAFELATSLIPIEQARVSPITHLSLRYNAPITTERDADSFTKFLLATVGVCPQMKLLDVSDCANTHNSADVIMHCLVDCVVQTLEAREMSTLTLKPLMSVKCSHSRHEDSAEFARKFGRFREIFTSSKSRFII